MIENKSPADVLVVLLTIGLSVKSLGQGLVFSSDLV